MSPIFGVMEVDTRGRRRRKRKRKENKKAGVGGTRKRNVQMYYQGIRQEKENGKANFIFILVLHFILFSLGFYFCVIVLFYNLKIS